jgi:pimeloyl-ACP methyl ester carboxylesterase
MHRKLELALAILNGAVGDYLERHDNGLSTEMAFMCGGEPLPLTRAALARAYPGAGAHVALLVHGLMCTETSWHFADGTDYGSLLERDLGYTPVYVRYNSGLSIPDNGARLAALLEEFVAAYPVPIESLLLLGYSMGGLVLRSACHVGSLEEHAWLPKVARAIYVGTPHLGAPLERLGRAVTKVLSSIDDPYTRLIADIANLRSDGVKDLGDAHLRHDDRRPRAAPVDITDERHPVPLLESMEHYLVAGSLWLDARLAVFFGDVIVPLSSATNGACIDAASMALPPSHVRIVSGQHHTRLIRSPEVYTHILDFCRQPARVGSK